LSAPLGFVVGLAAEARIARRLGLVAIGGGMPDGAQVAAETLIAKGVRGLVSFGLAGGLDPVLRPGDIIIPDSVRVGDTEFATADLVGPTSGVLLAGSAIAATRAAKKILFATTGAAAIDLESGAVARVAQRHNLPFAVLRAICDPAERDLPPAALAALDASGAIGIWRVLASIARAPGQLPDLIALARDAARARRALLRAVYALISLQPPSANGRAASLPGVVDSSL
jgi:adenosylhomocysteine nucleosidase